MVSDVLGRVAIAVAILVLAGVVSEGLGAIADAMGARAPGQRLGR